MEELTKEQEDLVLEQSKEGKKETTTLIDDANLAAKRLEDANKIKGELLNREEQLMAKQRLGGNSNAGETPKPAVETDVEYTERIMRGDMN